MAGVSDDPKTNVLSRIGAQPVALAAGALIVVVLVAASVGLWRAYTGNSPEQERFTSLRQMQARSTQASEQLFEKTKNLETSQQETIDQLQTVQEQLQTLRRLVVAQQADAKRLAEQVGGLTGAIDTLRQSFASTQASDSSEAPAARRAQVRSESRATRGHRAGVYRKRSKS
jgi:peptidoglycan hydrolase CwlO-like protein